MIIGLVEHNQGMLINASLEILQVGQTLAAYHRTDFFPMIIGKISPVISEGFQRYGILQAYQVAHPRLEEYAPDAWAEGLTQLIELKPVEAVIAVGTDRGNEVLARLSARMNLPFAANCIAIAPGEIYSITRLRWGGSLHEEAEVIGDPRLLSLAPHSFPVSENPSDVPLIVHTFSPELKDALFQVRVIRRIKPQSGVALGDAKVVVGGGRGVGSAEGFGILEELANLLGGAVGGSRVVTNLGWRPHSDQIGQTGTRIAPDLYIACGISGAIQHWVGCMGSKYVLAINLDPEAPIMEKADYAVIGDLHEVVTALCEELRKAKE